MYSIYSSASHANRQPPSAPATQVARRSLAIGTVAAAMLIVLPAVIGCEPRQGGLRRYEVSGSVTYAGAPVPLGELVLEPDRRNGNRGPITRARIVAGRYESPPDRGVVGGAYVATIRGGDGVNPVRESNHPYGKPLFKPYSKQIELSLEDQEVNFEIP